MIATGQQAPIFDGFTPADGPALLVFLETDCPTCQTVVPYLNSIALAGARVLGISQDDEPATAAFQAALEVRFPIIVDRELAISRFYDPEFVPTVLLVDESGMVVDSCIGLDKGFLNKVGRRLGHSSDVAPAHDGVPAWKPGCAGRQREPAGAGSGIERPVYLSSTGVSAGRLDVAGDPFEYCFAAFHDALPVIPPDESRIARMLDGVGLPPRHVVARVPPFYGEATVEKIAANAVMAGCEPPMMRVLIPLVRAVCDERFNAHGVQATTHFAAPLVIVNGPIRHELGFHSGQNLFGNTARANSTLGRALQLILLNLGGARPDTVDMSARSIWPCRMVFVGQ